MHIPCDMLRFINIVSACTTDPPEVGLHINRSEFIDNNIGASLLYSCQEGYYITPMEVSKILENLFFLQSLIPWLGM